MTLSILPGLAIAFLLVFGRVGALVMLMPGLGERAIPMRQRLALALFLALMVLPIARDAAIRLGSDFRIIGVLVMEILIGLMIGVAGRLILSVMEAVGSLISQNAGLSFAQTFDPSQGQQNELVASLMRMIGVMVIFSTDLHHIAIAGIFDSYQTLPLGETVGIRDAAALGVKFASDVFSASIRIAAPFIIFGLVFNVGIGLAARMTPQIQVFFLAMPLSVIVGLGVLAIVLGATAEQFHSFASIFLSDLFPGVR